jgi:hypothetical protein
MCSAARAYCVRCAIHEVASTTAMNVDVDKTGADPATFGIDLFCPRGYPLLGFPHINDFVVTAHDDGIVDDAVGQYR